MKILILGTTGGGKTTFARKLSAKLDIPHLELDSIYWKENWEATSETEFLAGLRELVLGDHWIIEGDYDLGRDLLLAHATHILWFDLPLTTTFCRLMRRSIRRLIISEKLWKGNQETWRGLFWGRDSLIRWFFKSHQRARTLYPDLLETAAHGGAIVLRIRNLQNFTA